MIHPQTEFEENVIPPRPLVTILLQTFLVIIAFEILVTFFGSSTLGFVSEFFIIVPASLYVLRNRLSFVEVFRLKAVKPVVWFYTILLTLVVFVLSDELDRLVALVFPMPDILQSAMRNLMKIHTVTDAIVLIGTAVVAAAFAEEMLFRGVVQRTLERIKDPAMAIVFSAIFFAMVHFNPWLTVQIMVLGAVLGYVAWKADSILPAIFLHGCNNLFSILLINASESSMGWYASANHVKPLWIGLAVLLFYPVLKGFNRACEREADSGKANLPSKQGGFRE